MLIIHVSRWGGQTEYISYNHQVTPERCWSITPCTCMLRYRQATCLRTNLPCIAGLPALSANIIAHIFVTLVLIERPARRLLCCHRATSISVRSSPWQPSIDYSAAAAAALSRGSSWSNTRSRTTEQNRTKMAETMCDLLIAISLQWISVAIFVFKQAANFYSGV